MRRLIILLAFGLVAAACGGGETSDSFESPTATTPPSDGTTTTVASTELPDSDYPDVLVADLAGGEVNLRELALEAEPVLLWFWAPH